MLIIGCDFHTRYQRPLSKLCDEASGTLRTCGHSSRWSLNVSHGIEIILPNLRNGVPRHSGRSRRDREGEMLLEENEGSHG